MSEESVTQFAASAPVGSALPKARSRKPAAKAVAKPTAKPIAKKLVAKKSVAEKPVSKKPVAKAVAKTAVKQTAKAAAAPAAPVAPAVTASHAAAGPANAPHDDIAETAAKSTLAINPLIGVRPQDFGEAAQTLFGAAAVRPDLMLWHWGNYMVEVVKILGGKSSVEPDPKDKRFADPAWRSETWLKRLVQVHALTGKELQKLIDDTDLDDRQKARAQLVAQIYVDAIAPSNSLLHPVARKKALETKGQSLIAGFKNMLKDWQENNGLPASVDKSKFALGKNLATTPGQVVFKNEVLELIQYAPTTEKVYTRPLLIAPPQVNKFYAMDLAPEKSLIRFTLANGIQTFAVSWRNPTEKNRDWGISKYVQALDEAVDAAREITGSPDVTLWGACSGGMTVAAYIGWQAAAGQSKVSNVVSPVCTLDPSRAMETPLGLFVTDSSLAATRAAVKARGVVDGSQLASMFAWMRPNDLIWNYWVNNYLLGNQPPAFDILYWNADTTRLPAQFHADMLDIICGSGFSQPGRVEVLGRKIDMGKVKVDAYVVAGITDHITPWKACYPTALMYGPKSTFTLANAGHLQSILNPPGAAKSFFFTGPVDGTDPDKWRDGAKQEQGSWWPHWMAWLHPRSGAQIDVPAKIGSTRHKAGTAAPGEYVLEP